MRYHSSIIETIGDTPLVKLNSVTDGIKGTVLAKVEYFNPKLHEGPHGVEDDRRRGGPWGFKPGEPSSKGPPATPVGIGAWCNRKGTVHLYACRQTVAGKDRYPTCRWRRGFRLPNVGSARRPRSYYSVAKRLNEEIENSFYPNQYDNLSNALAHYGQPAPKSGVIPKGKSRITQRVLAQAVPCAVLPNTSKSKTLTSLR